MFENLKNHITRQNLHKLRVQNIRYIKNEEIEEDNDGVNDEENDILDQLDHIQIIQKQSTFEEIMKRHSSNSNNEQEDDAYSNKKLKNQQISTFNNLHSKTQPKMNYSREYHLAVEQNNILRQNHAIQMKFQRQAHQRQLQLFQLEIDKFKLINIQLQKQDSKVKLLSKEVQNYRELYQVSQNRINELQENFSKVKLQNVNLMQKLSKFEKQQIFQNYKAQDTTKFSNEKERLVLGEIIQNLQKQILQKDFKIKNFDQKYKRACKQIQQLNLQIQALKKQQKNSFERLQQTWLQKVNKLQNLNIELSRKNTSLEQSLLEHLSQASRLIYNQNVNTTNATEPNIQAKIDYQREATKTRKKEEKYNIQDQSSIVVLQSDKKARKSFMEKSSLNINNDQIMDRRHSFKQKIRKQQNLQVKGNSNEKLKAKLQQANRKIIELIQWKCKAHSVNIIKR